MMSATSSLAHGKSATAKLLDLIAETMAVCAQARDAAERYEELRPMSNKTLAAMGLKRSELHRAAWNMMCDGSMRI